LFSWLKNLKPTQKPEDCKFFLKKQDFIRAFEAIIYAWRIFDTLSKTHLIKNIGKGD